MYPIKLEPIYDKTIWANHRLCDLRKVEDKGYGTCWEISAHPYAQSKIINGAYEGMTLQQLLDAYPQDMLGKHSVEKMLRLAYLDAAQDLSIQVHPDNAYAKSHENDMGKSESWYVLEADKGASLVAGTTIQDKDVIAQAIKDQTLDQYLVKVPVQAGDFIYIDAGMLHALGAGILAIEIGTNSNTTYRFYDYGRRDANGNERELHLKKGFDVVDLHKQSQKVSTPIPTKFIPQEKVLEDNEHFKVELYDIVDSKIFDTNHEDFHCLTFVYGDAILEHNGQTYQASYTDSVMIPAICGTYCIKGKCRVLKSTPK